MARNMGLDFGLDGNGKFCKRKFRWLFRIDNIIADNSRSQKTLPPLQSARPHLSFKEMPVNHLIETAYFPAKPDWKPIKLTLYDIKLDNNPIWDWIVKCYDPEGGQMFAPNGEDPITSDGFIKNAALDMFDGSGELVESWIYEDAWPIDIDFQTLDMGDSAIMNIEITLRYMRAYIVS